MKYDAIARDAIDQQPIGIHMALDESGEFAFQCVLSEGTG